MRCGIEILRVHIGKHDGASRSEAICDRRAHAAGADYDDDVVTQLVCFTAFAIEAAASVATNSSFSRLRRRGPGRSRCRRTPKVLEQHCCSKFANIQSPASAFLAPGPRRAVAAVSATSEVNSRTAARRREPTGGGTGAHQPRAVASRLCGARDVLPAHRPYLANWRVQLRHRRFSHSVTTEDHQERDRPVGGIASEWPRSWSTRGRPRTLHNPPVHHEPNPPACAPLPGVCSHGSGLVTQPRLVSL
jgi:hypothetical protein